VLSRKQNREILLKTEIMETITKINETALVKIKASDYGLDSTKAQEIELMFKPMLEKMTALESDYNEILKLDISPETCYRAKELRLQYVKVRTKTAEIHKELKSFYLNGGRFVDGWKNAQLFASQEIEDNLKKIETHFEIIEAERKEKLKTERAGLITPYVEDVNTYMLGEMTEDAFNKLLVGAKLQFELRIEAEKKAEEERIAREKAEAEERERIKQENERLKKEAEEKEKELLAERERIRKENEKKERLAEIERKKASDALKAQQVKADKERKELLAKAETERKEKERLEAEIADKKATEEKAKRDVELKLQVEERARKAAERKAKLAPDKTKLLGFMQVINDLPRPEVKSIEAADIAAKVNIMLVQAANYIKEHTGNM
jgi:hypothetical protein